MNTRVNPDFEKELQKYGKEIGMNVFIVEIVLLFAPCRKMVFYFREIASGHYKWVLKKN